MGRQVKTTCLKCNETVTIDFGNSNYSEALKLADQLDKTPMECSGYHVEVGGWKKYWQLNQIIEELYTEVEKDICGDIARRITVQLLDSENPEKEYEFKTELETDQFIRGLIDGGFSSDSSLKVTYYNYIKEKLGSYVAPAKTSLLYLAESLAR
ncbi:hypothetical protein TCA2_4467 [Paenibacillus sp. TCA20]|uniref:hypothetical protein n=1 Tax=Paenibacillus sp. TCA20 TaxID=1499968 RepID=UPI0004D54C10|nr:hypothetical protein [Paenibacillus sp. TCA20]GAK41975.1 hypothetical protein TCA2_4467 [Paenibacillus sp. TCA20]